ncbi:hypothetical protein VMT65_16215 [Nocardia sp. CDC153]|uniref:hypothetical protein n=1 Tax=Nocardia sp. CDC153 TaxID=3112167 RepID=UPI002DBC53E9|nr:hypothetical protein [Nocardia sp. CDC153]MEC3954585.1 hypothetical protein [Nocardia sp. CDC153]
MTIEYIGKADSMLAEYTAMLQRSDARNAEAKALLAEAEELAAEVRHLESTEFMMTPDEVMQSNAHRALLEREIDAKSGRVLQLHQETFHEWESWTARQY